MSEPLVPLSHVDAIIERKVKEVLGKMLGLSGQSLEPESVPITEAAARLGYENPTQIYKDIAAGLLRVGHEVEDRRRPGRKKPRYFINIAAAKTRLKQNPEKRRAI
ncbi:MAG: hypothetical protein F6K19_22130 [Cyanothece sp. SIO1E1]|nr:hypothetical protein [Cyanothece sp. SIO1E1]